MAFLTTRSDQQPLAPVGIFGPDQAVWRVPENRTFATVPFDETRDDEGSSLIAAMSQLGVPSFGPASTRVALGHCGLP
jgi:hypothetical protein